VLVETEGPNGWFRKSAARGAAVSGRFEAKRCDGTRRPGREATFLELRTTRRRPLLATRYTGPSEPVRHYAEAEGMGFEPTTPFGAPDFETREACENPRKLEVSDSRHSIGWHTFHPFTDQFTDCLEHGNRSQIAFRIEALASRSFQVSPCPVGIGAAGFNDLKQMAQYSTWQHGPRCSA
jgi:hypothetical protein